MSDCVQEKYYRVPQKYIHLMREALLSETQLTCLDYLNDIEDLFLIGNDEHE